MFCQVDKNDHNLKKFGSYIIHENEDRYYLPRLMYRYYNDVKVYKDNKFELKVPKKFKFLAKLRDAQIQITEDLFNVIERDGFLNGIVHARPATGKTVTAIYLAHKLNLITLIIIDNKKIVGQQKEEILRHTDLDESDIGLIRGDIFDVENKAIIVTTPQTLSSKFKNHRDTFYPKFKDIGIGLYVWDEVHKIANVQASASLLFNSAHFIGLSATPFHDKEKSRLMYSLFGEVESQFGEYDFSPTIKFHHYDSGLEKKYGKRVNFMWSKDMNMARAVYNKALLDSSAQANLCVDIMEEEVSKNNKIIVIVFTQAQLILLHDLAKERGLKPVKLYSKVNKINKDEDDLVIATQKYASEAFDYPGLNRLLIAVPLLGRKSLIQTIGRILRSCTGKFDAIVHDLIDTGKNFNNIFVDTVAIKTNILSQEYDDCTYEKV